MEFKEGDVVRLKSGGPEMSIESIRPLNFYSNTIGVHCCWFDSNTIKRDAFIFEILEKVNETNGT